MESLKEADKSTYGNLDPYAVKYDKKKKVIYYDGGWWPSLSFGDKVILKDVPNDYLSSREVKKLIEALKKTQFWRGFESACKDIDDRKALVKKWKEEEKTNPVLRFEKNADSEGFEALKEGGIKKGDRYWYIKAFNIDKFDVGNVNKYYFAYECTALTAAEMFKCGYKAVQSDTW